MCYPLEIRSIIIIIIIITQLEPYSVFHIYIPVRSTLFAL